MMAVGNHLAGVSGSESNAGREEVLCRLDITGWTGPFPASTCGSAVTALERGRILIFPRLEFAFRDDEQCLFSPAFSDGDSKNISLKPSGELGGSAATGEMAGKLAGMMARFAAGAEHFVAELLPPYSGKLERARTSYRPVEILGRSSSTLRDDTRLHNDAFPSQPMRGRRILRLFTNVNPYGESRDWRVGEPFEDVARKLGPRVHEGSQIYDGLLAAVGITKGRRSPYDNLMLGLHNTAKRDSAYQAEMAQVEVSFPPGSTWLCFTDQVMHAVVKGQYALEQTFHLDVETMTEPRFSPLKVLERLRGRALV